MKQDWEGKGFYIQVGYVGNFGGLEMLGKGWRKVNGRRRYNGWKVKAVKVTRENAVES